MATINSCTDILQSKRLKEILPLESADMFIADVFLNEEQTHSYKFHFLTTWGHKNFDELKERENKFVHFIPCWSLVALLDIIPYPILYKHADETWNCASWVEKVKHYFVEGCDSPINACYEMILKLKNLNLI